jgi:hypothetical protein
MEKSRKSSLTAYWLQNQGYSQDANNYYVWYTMYFSDFRFTCRFFRVCVFFIVNMLPHAQELILNMDACRACEEKPICHTKTGREKQRKPKKQPNPQAVLWHF